VEEEMARTLREIRQVERWMEGRNKEPLAPQWAVSLSIKIDYLLPNKNKKLLK
jgi:hypothetical protein